MTEKLLENDHLSINKDFPSLEELDSVFDPYQNSTNPLEQIKGLQNAGGTKELMSRLKTNSQTGL